MMPKGLKFFLGAAVVALAPASQGQQALNWRVYKLADGLAESACLTVAIAPQGKVLVRHLAMSAISQLDGYTVSVMPAPESARGRIYGSPGGQLWTVAPEGLEEYHQGEWILHPMPDIAAEFRARPLRSQNLIPLCPVRQGLVIIELPEKLLEFNQEASQPITVLRAARDTQLANFSGMTLSHDGGLWVAGAHGLAKIPGPLRNLRPETEWREYPIPADLQIQNLQEPHEDVDGGVIAVADSSKDSHRVLVQLDGDQWQVQAIGGQRIREAWRGPAGSYWAASRDALFQYEDGKPIENQEFSARTYFDLAVEPGGVFWLATAEGLFRFAPLSWRNTEPVRKLNSLVECVTGDAEGRLWFVAGDKLHSLHNDRHEEYSLPETFSASAASIRGLFPLKEGGLVLDAGGQLIEFQPGSGTFRALPDGTARALKPLGVMADGGLCVQSVAGLGAPPDYRLKIYEGGKLEPLPEPPPGSPLGAELSCLFASQNGELWLGGEHGTAWFHDHKWITFSSADKTSPESALDFADLPDGRIFCATQDKIWEFNGRNWALIRQGFDHINTMLRTRDGGLWIASNSGLHRFFHGAWVETGVEEGLPSAAVHALYEDQRGRLWAGTSRGLSIYHPEADTDPPQTFIHDLPDKEKNIPEGSAIVVAFSGQDKWKYTPRERLLFSYRLDGHDWSAFQEADHVSFADLPAGKHYFQVRAIDRNCNVDASPAQLEFVVVLPWYKEARLVFITVAGIAAVIFFAALAFNRHRRLLRSYAEVEQIVAERTRELELANRELLHSQKMNALGTLAAGIAHDFNNILSIIKGSAQIIEDSLNQPDKIRTRVDRIKTVVEQGAGVVKAMLGFTRNSDASTSRADLNQIVADTLRLLGDRFLREVEVRFEPGADLPEVACARDFVQQILLNFIFNAAEAMTSDKQIIVCTERLEQLPGGLALTPARAPAYLCVSVRDAGCGIPPANLSRIFEPFFTTKALSARRGTGLGLSMAYELASKMDAGLGVESVLDQGSTFTLILPVT